jgi:hypothetical protein
VQDVKRGGEALRVKNQRGKMMKRGEIRSIRSGGVSSRKRREKGWGRET